MTAEGEAEADGKEPEVKRLPTAADSMSAVPNSFANALPRSSAQITPGTDVDSSMPLTAMLPPLDDRSASVGLKTTLNARLDALDRKIDKLTDFVTVTLQDQQRVVAEAAKDRAMSADEYPDDVVKQAHEVLAGAGGDDNV